MMIVAMAEAGRVLDMVGIVTTLEGQPLPAGDIASRLGAFADVEQMERAGSVDAEVIEVLLGNKNNAHNNYQDFQAFLDNGGHIVQGAAQGGGRVAPEQVAKIAVPENLAAIIEHYIAKLENEQRTVLSAAAVCGVQFRVNTIAAALERLGWSFVRVRGSEFFLNPEKAMKPVLARLSELKIRPEGGNAEAPQNGKDVLERILRRAAEYRQHWLSHAKAQTARGGNGVPERSRKAAKKKGKTSARK